VYVLLDFTWNACIKKWIMLMLFYFLLWGQLITEFVEKENIPLEGVRRPEILLGRDTRPSGESLLEAAKQVLRSLFPNYELCTNGLGIVSIALSKFCLCFKFG
jgi:hypothetical protein